MNLQMRSRIRQRLGTPAAALYAAAVLVSAFVMLSQALPLPGTPVAFVITVLLLFYLPGILLARFLGKLALANPVQRFCWILACAFGMTVPIGAAFRLLQLPVSVYILCLHIVMLLLALAPPKQEDATTWRFTLGNAPLYLLLTVCCVIVLFVALERGRFRFDGYEDQTVFAELADWLSHEPDDMSVRSRRVGVLNGDARWDTDGWTYSHAAWVWASGVPAAELIWFNLTPLFAWTVPLAIFGMAYELTRREDTAVYTVAFATVFGLMTIDALVYYRTWLTFGQFSLFQVNTLRAISTALVMPLALIPVFAWLHQPGRGSLLLILLTGIAVATMHPRQAVIYLCSVGITTLLWWLARPERRRLPAAAAVIAVLACVAIVPLVQRIQRPSVNAETARRLAEVSAPAASVTQSPVESMATAPAPATVPDPAPVAEENAGTGMVGQGNPRGDLLSLRVPILDDSFIVDPRTVFYHPLMIAGVLAGLFAGLWWKRDLAAQYLFGTTAVMLVLLFVPGISDIFIRTVTALVAPSVALGIPVTLALAYMLDLVVQRLLSPGLVPAFRWFFASVVVVVCALLLFEPIPIPASARDQIRASNAMQALRDIQPADKLLLDTLRQVLPGDERAVLITPDHVAGYITESVPFAFVTGGRASSNLASAGSRRFVNEISPQAPWLDTQDIEFMREWGVTHIVLDIDDTRLTQLLLQPNRFEFLAGAAGYRIFRVLPGLESGRADALFGEMNGLYQVQGTRRWGPHGFALELPGTMQGWTAIAEQWLQLGDSEIARLGLAFTETMMADDARSLELWAELREGHPQQPAFLQAVALAEATLGRPEQGASILLSALDADDPVTRVVAARLLLTETFFYLLNDEQLQRVVDVTASDNVTWEQLASHQRLDLLRQRIVLMMGRQQWEIAEQWSGDIPEAEVDPRDLTTRALIALAQGDLDGALRELEPTTVADLVAANRHLHPDRWQDNIAAQTYHILRGDAARRDQRWSDAAEAYNQAIAAGNRWAARYWLAETYRQQGMEAEADDLNASLREEWQTTFGAGFPEPVSLLELLDAPLPYVVGANIQLNDAAGKMRVDVITGNLHAGPLPVRALRVEVTDPEATTFYATAEVPVASLVGALTRVTVELDLPPDLPELSPALVFVEPRYDNRVTFGKPVSTVILNRPDDATVAEDAIDVGRRFGEHIVLEQMRAGAHAEALELTLYWRADAPLQSDYHVFTHVVDGNGQIVQQHDAAPVEGRYPTRQWRVDTLIEDTRTVNFDTPLPPGAYHVLVGLYQPDNGTRLSITPDDERVEANAFRVLSFDVEPS